MDEAELPWAPQEDGVLITTLLPSTRVPIDCELEPDLACPATTLDSRKAALSGPSRRCVTKLHVFASSAVRIRRPRCPQNNPASPRPASPLTSGPDSGPDTPSSKPSSNAAASGSSIARPLSPPGGPRAAIRRRAAADHKDSIKNARPSSTRAAGAGGSSGTMLRLYTDESQGFRVDPVVVLVLSLGFIMSVVALHIIAKITKRFS
ncbi:hypothetical protein EPUS_02891 [Endocarpon pusillum Z07020]|uniref:Protein transport protein Sec61 subunit beta n=1 Tax=Endocarpon pusillum (strain Z07020 / HMAS-L-300199) TaxID=1263415 RepID=U1HNZ4_ENDPU|nr:uncharacterized protein EPUS_02891 [Endocarpon pusillum Z07020]ERF72100.1 hypothetical protein EPUS_02891 [Endocarpon pusillum Z07020]